MSNGVTQLIVRLILWTSTVCCLIVIASFAIFAVDQTNAASTRQATQVGQAGSSSAPQASGAPTVAAPSATPAAKRPTIRSRIDEAASTLRSPFSAVTSEFHDEWVVQLVGLVLALAVYGLLLRFIARAVGLSTRSA